MVWKRNIEEIKIFCKKCGTEMTLESSYNCIDGIYFCKECDEHIHIKI